jgi:large subunit ribosomal protein L18
MNKVILRKSNRERRKLRVRKKIFGTAEHPRLSVFRSLKYIYAQLIDDTKGKTLVYAQSKKQKGTKSEDAFAVGKELAKIAKEKGIKEAVFDRNGYQYHGRLQKLAEGAREGGLKI